MVPLRYNNLAAYNLSCDGGKNNARIGPGSLLFLSTSSKEILMTKLPSTADPIYDVYTRNGYHFMQSGYGNRSLQMVEAYEH